MAKFQFTTSEKQDVKNTVSHVKSLGRTQDKAWDENQLNSLKLRIKTNNMTKTSNKCCYCFRDFSNNYLSVVDSEHILPKSIWPKYTFTMKNLSVACKRCNSTVKRFKVDFLNGLDKYNKKPFQSKYYKILHPNLDDAIGNLELISYQTSSTGNILKYLYSEGKGKYTYEFFRLKELEIESINESQGVKKRSLINANVPDELLEELYTNLKNL